MVTSRFNDRSCTRARERISSRRPPPPSAHRSRAEHMPATRGKKTSPAKKASPAKSIAKKEPAKKSPAKKAPAKAAAKKASPAKSKKGRVAYGEPEMAELFAPEPGSDLDIKTRIKAVIAVLQDSPVSEDKAQAAAMILDSVLNLL